LTISLFIWRDVAQKWTAETSSATLGDVNATCRPEKGNVNHRFAIVGVTSPRMLPPTFSDSDHEFGVGRNDRWVALVPRDGEARLGQQGIFHSGSKIAPVPVLPNASTLL